MEKPNSSNSILRKQSWFNRFLASICIFGSIFLFLGITAAHATDMRKIDGSIGLLTRPLTEAGRWAESMFYKGVKVEAADAVIVVNLEAILNKALKEAASAIIKSFTSFLLNKFDELIKAFDAFGGVGDALRNAFGSFMAATTLWVDQQMESLGKSSQQAAYELAPNASDEVKRALSGGIQSVVVQDTLNKVVPANAENLSITSADQVASNTDTLASAVAKANGCGSLTNEQKKAFIIFPFINNGCVYDSKSQAEQQVNQMSAERVVKAQEKKDDIQKQASNCQFGFLNFSTDPTASTNGFSGGSVDVSGNYSVASFGPQLQTFTNQFTPESLPPDQCYAYTTGKQDATLAVPQATANQGNNEFDVNAIISQFVDAITKFFSQLIQKLLDVAVSAINKFLSAIPGGQYLSNALTEIAGQTTQGVNQLLSNITIPTI